MVGIDLFVISPLLPAIARDVGVDPARTGWTVTAFAIAYLVGGPALARRAERRGHHAVLGGALLVFTLANTGTGLAPSFGTLLATRAVAGLAAAGITPSVFALVSAAAPPDERGRRLAVVTSGLLLAMATGAPAGTLLAAVTGWRLVFFGIAAATGVIAAVVMVPFVIATGASRPAPGTPERRPVGAPDTSSRPSAWLRIRAVSVTTCWAMAVYALYTYLGTILVETVGLTPALTAAALTCFGFGAVTGNLAGGRLTDRYGGMATSVASLLALAVAQAGVAVLLAVHAGTAALFALLAATALAGYPFFSAQQVRLITRYPGVGGSLLAWNNSAMYAGILLGSAAGGPVLAGLGAPALVFGAAAVAAIGAVAAAGGRGLRTDGPAG